MPSGRASQIIRLSLSLLPFGSLVFRSSSPLGREPATILPVGSVSWSFRDHEIQRVQSAQSVPGHLNFIAHLGIGSPRRRSLELPSALSLPRLPRRLVSHSAAAQATAAQRCSGTSQPSVRFLSRSRTLPNSAHPAPRTFHSTHPGLLFADLLALPPAPESRLNVFACRRQQPHCAALGFRNRTGSLIRGRRNPVDRRCRLVDGDLPTILLKLRPKLGSSDRTGEP
jgi:hypothetical protein